MLLMKSYMIAGFLEALVTQSHLPLRLNLRERVLLI